MQSMASSQDTGQGGAHTADDWLAEADGHEQDGRLEAAEEILTTVLGALPDYPPALHRGAILSHKRKRPLEAIERLERAILVAPDQPLFHRNLCELYRGQSRLDEALAHGLRAAALAPDDPDAHYNLGVVHYDRMEIDQAIACARSALALRPDMASAHFELAEALLLDGQFAEGWREYEWRFSLPGAPPLLPFDDKPLWDGRAMPSGVLMLIGDQGFGDTIQFCRYIVQVAQLCPNIILCGSSEMRPIIIQQSGEAPYFSRWEDAPAFDAYCPLSGLPRLFATDLSTIPASPAYLKPDPAKVAYWRGRLGDLVPGGFQTIGVAWAGRPSHGNDFNRSMSLKTLAPLGGLERTALVSLQMGPAMAQVADYYGAAPLINLGPEIADFADTMAILALLDQVAAVDTSIVHLACAMGRPTSVLLPFAPDWRWLRERNDSPWYPSLRLFRQRRSGGWSQPVQALVDRLRETRAGQGPDEPPPAP
jgi:Tfp pilus assembly protein PilF